MKNQGILNAQLMRVIAEMGHTDGLVIADAGLPVPLNVERIDLTLVAGVPSFMQTLCAVMGELCVERSVIATETKEHNRKLYDILAADERAVAAIKKQFPTFHAPPDISMVAHTEFKALSTKARAVVRTAETVPYANIILYSGVTF